MSLKVALLRRANSSGECLLSRVERSQVRHDKCLFAMFLHSLDPQPTWAAKEFSLDSQRQESFYKLLLQFRESRIDPRKYRSCPELREDALCLGQMLNREGTLFLDLVKQAQNHLCAANMMPVRIKM